jgi:hypothetical protein
MKKMIRNIILGILAMLGINMNASSQVTGEATNTGVGPEELANAVDAKRVPVLKGGALLRGSKCHGFHWHAKA